MTINLKELLDELRDHRVCLDGDHYANFYTTDDQALAKLREAFKVVRDSAAMHMSELAVAGVKPPWVSNPDYIPGIDGGDDVKS